RRIGHRRHSVRTCVVSNSGNIPIVEPAGAASTGERREYRVPDGLDGTEAIDLAKFGRPRISRGRPLSVVRDQRLGLRVIDREPLFYRVLAIVLALAQP